jgi:hypothetical protein
MTEQPEALRLADLIQSRYGNDINDEAAAELRRLHAENASLLEQNTMLDAKLAELERVSAQLLEALEGADETIDWLMHHLTQHHRCLHMDATVSGIPAWIAKTRAAIKAAKGGA